MSTNNEVNVLLYLVEQVLQPAIDAIKVIVADYNLAGALTEEQIKNITISRTSIELDPDGEFDLTVQSEDKKTETSSPVILAEIDKRKSESNSVTGSRVMWNSNFSFLVLVAKENREWRKYKKEACDLVDFIENTFKATTTKRILVGDSTFSDFKFRGIKVSGAVTPITTYVNQYDYSITT